MFIYSLHFGFDIVQLLQKRPADGWLEMSLYAERVDATKHGTSRSYAVPAGVLL